MILLFIIGLAFDRIGDVLITTNHPQPAINYYELYYRMVATDPKIRLKLGQTAYLLGNYQLSIRYLDQLDLPQAKLWLGLSYFQLGDYHRCEKILSQVEGDTAQYYRGISLFKLGRYGEALTVLSSLPGSEAQFFTGLVLARIGREEEALALIDQNQGGWWEEYRRYLHSYLRDRMRLPLKYKTGDRVRFLLARQRFEIGEIESALSILDSIQGFDDLKAIDQVLCYLKLNWNKKAIQTLKALPGTSKIRNLLFGYAFLNLRDYRSARHHFHNAGRSGYTGLIKTFYQEGRYDSVIHYIERLRGIPSIEIRFIYAKSLYNLQRYPTAISVGKEIIAIDPTTNYAQQAYILIGEAYQLMGHPDSARMIWNNFVERYPASPLAGLAMKRIGDSYYAEKNYERAIQAYLKVEDLPHTTSLIEDAAFRVEMARYRAGITRSYLTVLKRYINRFPESRRAPKLGLRIGDIYKKSGRLKSALWWYEKTAQNYPAVRKEALFRIARVKEMRNDVPGLKQTLLEIIAIDSTPEAIEELAHLYFSIEEFDSAILWFEKLNRIEGYQDLAALELARIYRKIDRIREAEVFLRPLTNKESPLRDDAIILLAEILRETGRLDEAKRILSQIEENPKGHLILGEIELLFGNYLSARNEFIRAGSLFADDRNACAEALIQAGDAAAKAKDWEEAKKLYEQAQLLTSDPRIKIRAKERVERLP
ncbi:hypothetical protein DRP53_06200 [candidate division WOR-3 bacterium]|uniref:Tetratricopeptide repeat protein n=1 Tax=candidate division WOR-3 bacterium TaxID=2052148 RepID=A0A660SH95_UNCW3|nr:MAG: hypothetical protein DRP53_06200 [candidate division WOR-3 bacterium]